ncbi:hypothetical protein EsDP_00006241 [Epichloe bromicola]|uniref:AA1-like domain-containing protein n=1 Tax=Epichloe bromicola TaxID=79588 RepID=A0ABQ0CXG0_9HYPO
MLFLLLLTLASQAVSRPADRVCTALSARSLEWTIRDFEMGSSEMFTTPAHRAVSRGAANFTLENTALSYRFRCEAVSARGPDYLYGDDVWDCAAPAEPGGDASRFSFDRPTGLLRVEQAWGCDRDGSRFAGAGQVRLHLACETRDYKNDRWEMGQVYSRRDVVCAKVDVPVVIEYLSGTA